MSGARILVVDDQPQMLRSLRLMLGGHGYDVTAVATGRAAIEAVERRAPDVILLDLMLPDMTGLDVFETVRDRCTAAVIILSAHGEEGLKVTALDRGADDYITKPFSANELLARVRVALRHSAGLRLSNVFEAGELRVDFDRRQVKARGQPVTLTPREYDVLKYFVTNADRVLTHTTILRFVWGPEYDSEPQYLRNVVLALRRKLEPDPSHPRYIVTEPGVGYRFTTPGEAV
jgi:two-component system KDP operon response regulator KdpE